MADRNKTAGISPDKLSRLQYNRIPNIKTLNNGFKYHESKKKH